MRQKRLAVGEILGVLPQREPRALEILRDRHITRLAGLGPDLAANFVQGVSGGAEATAAYQRLLGSNFEPEATIGLRRTLHRLAQEQAAAGEVEEVRALVERVTAPSDASQADTATVVASVLERAGRYSEAREQLEAAITNSVRTGERTRLHQRAGGLAVAEGDLDLASAHFLAAWNWHASPTRTGRIGQVQIRMALVAILRDDLVATGEHLLAAVRAWRDAGAIEPAAALIGELRGLQRLRQGSWEAAAGKALELVERASDAEAVGHVELALTPLRRELT